MPCCDTGRNIQKYKGAAASTLQDVTDNGNTTTGDIITTSGFFIGDGSKLTGISGASAAFTLQETTDRGNTTSNVVQFTNPFTSLTASGNVVISGNVTASNFYGDGTTLDGVALSTDLESNVGRIEVLESKTTAISYTDSTTTIYSNLEISGNLSITGNTYIINSDTLVIEDRIIGIANNNTSHTLDVGIVMQHPDHNIAIVHHGSATESDPHEHVLTIGYTQNTVSDNHITDDTSNSITVEVLGNLIVQNNLTISEGSIYGDGTQLDGVALKTDLNDNSSRISTISTDLNDNSSRISTISTDLNDNSSRITNISTDLNDNSSRISILDSNLADNSSRIDALETEVQPVNRGGTNITTYAKGDILIASSTNTLSNLSLGTGGYVLTSNNTSGLPEWKSSSDLGTQVAQLSNGSYILGGSYNGITPTTWSVQASTSNTSNYIVARDTKGDIFVSNVNAIQYYGDGGTLSNIVGSQNLQEVINENPYTNSPPYFGGGSYGAIYGSNTINASTISTATGFYGPIKGSNTITADTISTTSGFYGPIKGSNTITGTLISDDASAINRLNASNVTTGTLSIARGGTNITTYAKGDILIASATNTLSKLGLGQGGYVLTSNALSTLPEWRSASTIGATVETLSTGNYLTGGPYNGSGTATFDVQGTTTNTSSNLVARDNSGDIYVERVIVGTGSTGTLSASAWSGSAAKLTTARLIGGVSFDGSVDINLPGVNTAGNQNTSGSAAKLTTARLIGGVSFDGSVDINLPGVNTAGNQNTSGSAAKISVSDSTSSSQLPLPFMSAATGDVTLYSDSGVLQYQASTGTLSSSQFSGSGSGLTSLNAGNINSGTLSNAYGGTGFTSYSQGDLLVGTGSGSNLRKLARGAANYVLTVNSSGSDIEWQAASGGGSSLWTQSGNDIYYNSGNVGIQTNTPQYELDVSGNVNITQKLLVNGTPGITGNVLGINSTSSGLEWVKAPDKVKVTANNSATYGHKIIFSTAYLASEGDTTYADLKTQNVLTSLNEEFSFTPSESLLKVGVIRTGKGTTKHNSISNSTPTHTLHVGDNIIMHDYANYDVFRVNGNVFTTGHFVGDGSYITGIKQIKNETDTDVIVAGDGAPTRKSLLSRFYN
jgi:hypothetical protein